MVKLLFLGKDEPGCWEMLRAQLDVGCGVCARCLGRIWNSLWFAAPPGCQAWSRAGFGPDGLGETAGNVTRRGFQPNLVFRDVCPEETIPSWLIPALAFAPHTAHLGGGLSGSLSPQNEPYQAIPSSSLFFHHQLQLWSTNLLQHLCAIPSIPIEDPFGSIQLPNLLLLVRTPNNLPLGTRAAAWVGWLGSGCSVLQVSGGSPKSAFFHPD